MCRSNWLAGHASIVQWPELCGRGAISLTSTRPVRVDEHLDGEQADQVQRLRDAPGHPPSLGGGGRRDPSGREGQVQDAVAVPVLHGVEHRAAAVRAARDDDADFAREVDEAFQDQRLRLQRSQPAARSAGSRNTAWPLPS